MTVFYVYIICTIYWNGDSFINSIKLRSIDICLNIRQAITTRASHLTQLIYNTFYMQMFYIRF